MSTASAGARRPFFRRRKTCPFSGAKARRRSTTRTCACCSATSPSAARSCRRASPPSRPRSSANSPRRSSAPASSACCPTSSAKRVETHRRCLRHRSMPVPWSPGGETPSGMLRREPLTLPADSSSGTAGRRHASDRRHRRRPGFGASLRSGDHRIAAGGSAVFCRPPADLHRGTRLEPSRRPRRDRRGRDRRRRSRSACRPASTSL